MIMQSIVQLIRESSLKHHTVSQAQLCALHLKFSYSIVIQSKNHSPKELLDWR